MTIKPKNMSKSKLTFILSLLWLPTLVIAQSDLGNIQLDVTRAFEGEVQQARKINDIPRVKDTLSSDVQLDYQIRPRSVFTDFAPEPLSPARIKRVPAAKLPKLMARLGAGNYLTPLAELSFTSDRSRNQSWGVKARHFSTQSGVPNTHFADVQEAKNVNFLSENKLSAHYRRFFRNYTLTTRAEGFYYANNLYGVPAMDWNEELSYGNPARQSFLGGLANVSLNSQKTKQDRFFDDGHVRYRFLVDRFGSDEHHVALPTSWSFPVDDQLVKLDLTTQYQRASSSDYDMLAEYVNVHAHPHLDYVQDELSVNIGLNFIYNNNNLLYRGEQQALDNVFVFPEVVARYRVAPDVFELFGGVDYDFSLNTTANIIREVPWMNPGMRLQPTRKEDFFVGSNVLVMPGLSLEASARYINWRDLVTFYRDPIAMTNANALQGLDLRYVTGNELGLSGSLQYKYSTDLTFGSYINYSRYEFEGGDIPYHLAPWRGGMNVRYTFRNKIALKAELLYVGAREAFNPKADDILALENVVWEDDFHILPSFWDMDVQVDYHLSQNLTFFLKVHNAFASRYDMYLGYGAQRFLALAGFSFKL